jgi:hypothetical protein
MKITLSPEQVKIFKSQITAAFRKLRKAGYIAKQKFWCCQSCGWAALPDDAEKVVFYHAQDADCIQNGDFYLAWAGDGQEIVSIFNSCGIVATWSGTNDSRIHATFNPLSV